MERAGFFKQRERERQGDEEIVMCVSCEIREAMLWFLFFWIFVFFILGNPFFVF